MSKNNNLQLPANYNTDTPEQYMERLLAFYQENYWLIHVLAFNFVTLKEWEKFPKDWRDAIMDRVEAAGDNWAMTLLDLTSPHSDYTIWPESMRKYLETTRDLALTRGSVIFNYALYLYNETHQNIVVDEATREQNSISKHILGGMSDKKIHEVECMSRLIKTVADQHNISSVIDLGSGQGYLSRVLALDYGFDVLAVDMCEIQTKGAIKYDNKALKLQNQEDYRLQHVTEKLTSENIASVLARWSPESQHKPWLVTGLHTCGDLSPMIFKLFQESPQIKCVLNVGCCYNALTFEGFPMSQYLKNKGDDMIHVGSTAKVLSCHSPSRWLDEGQKCVKAFDNYYFRALLQEMLVDRGLSDINDPPILGRIKQNKKFVPFVKASLKRLKLPEDTITAEEAEAHFEQSKAKSVDKQFVSLWILRGLLAPITESILLMDRWFYLNEHSTDVEMYPLFDLAASPRNVVYIASKE